MTYICYSKLWQTCLQTVFESWARLPVTERSTTRASMTHGHAVCSRRSWVYRPAHVRCWTAYANNVRFSATVTLTLTRWPSYANLTSSNETPPVRSCEVLITNHNDPQGCNILVGSRGGGLLPDLREIQTLSSETNKQTLAHLAYPSRPMNCLPRLLLLTTATSTLSYHHYSHRYYNLQLVDWRFKSGKRRSNFSQIRSTSREKHILCKVSPKALFVTADKSNRTKEPRMRSGHMASYIGHRRFECSCQGFLCNKLYEKITTKYCHI